MDETTVNQEDFDGSTEILENFSGVENLPPIYVPFAGEVHVNLKKLPHYGDLPSIALQTAGSVGFDLFSASDAPILLNNMGARALVPTGISLELPAQFEAQIRPRSGLAANKGVTVLNAPGTIDSDYRGEIKVILVNTSNNRVTINRGDRIAQMVIVGPLPRVVFSYVDQLSETERGEGGFGSTGISLP